MGQSPGPEQGTSPEITRAINEILSTDTLIQDEYGNKTRADVLIKNILLISTDYDHFILEEEGRLNELFINAYRKQERFHIPSILHSREEDTLKNLISSDYDVVFLFNPPQEDEALDLAKRIKQSHPHIPVVLIGKNTPDLGHIHEHKGESNLDWVFTWSGDGKVLVDIVQFIEQQMLSQNGSNPENAPKVLLADPNPLRYSQLLFLASGAITNHMDQIMDEDLPSAQKRFRLQKRPQILIARNADEADRILKQHGNTLIFLALNAGLARESSGQILATVKDIMKRDHRMQVLLLSQDAKDKEIIEGMDAQFQDCSSSTFSSQFTQKLRKGLGPITLNLENGDGIVTQINDIRALEKGLWTLPDERLKECLKEGEVQIWLRARFETDLAGQIQAMETEGILPDELRRRVIGLIKEHRTRTYKGVLTQYSRKTYGTHARFSRIGHGAMGGKARGLAFMDKVLSAHLPDGTIPQIKIAIPRTIVLCSDVFDDFLRDNSLSMEVLAKMPDDRIALRFMEADLPATVLGDLRSFIRETKVPLVIRSSSLLEDALHHPFAGVYASLLLPNESWETDIRYQELCTAIKYVFASVFFQRARTYMQTIELANQEEKMAVIIEELVGKKHGNIYYPTISGVGKSFDYYPSGPCKPNDGVVNLVLGLGKEVVEGGNSYRFCPLHPKTPKHGTLKDLLRQAQQNFFAVDLNAYTNIVQRDEDSTICKFEVSVAESHGNLIHTASTFNPQDERITPGIGREGPRILDFAPILQLNTIPLPVAIRVLLRIGEIALGTPVEIEFSVNLPTKKGEDSELFLLQVRSMASNVHDITVPIGEFDQKDVLVHSLDVLGNGVKQDIQDIIYVKREGYELSQNMRVANQIRKLNQELVQKRIPFMLIGPGRWGSTDSWLGIPVGWSDIAGASIIVETPVEERPIDPSQGSHFFHNMIAARTAYFTLTRSNGGIIDWEFLEALDAVQETHNLRHVRLTDPIEARLDGSVGEGLILKPKNIE